MPRPNLTYLLSCPVVSCADAPVRADDLRLAVKLAIFPRSRFAQVRATQPHTTLLYIFARYLT